MRAADVRPNTRKRCGGGAVILLAALVTSLGGPVSAQSSGGSLYDESAAYSEGAMPLRLNPAGASVRYPGEFAFSMIDGRSGRDRYVGGLEAGGLRFTLGGAENERLTYSLGLGGGHDEFRSGVEATWVPRQGGGRGVDWRIGTLSRPRPWLSWGGIVDHIGRPSIGAGPLERTYRAAIGVRPLALHRGRAHTLGTRLTLTADASITEAERLEDTRLRFGAEVELAPGLAVRGAWDDRDDGYRVGVSLFGIGAAAHAAATYDRDGDHVGTVWTGSHHQGEDRTVFRGPRDRRVAVVRAGGALGDDQLSGFSIDGPTSVAPSASLHRQLEAALEDPLTKGVLLDVRGVGNMAQLEELRPRIRRLRDAGKPVVAYLEYGGGRGDLYLAAACDRIVATPDALYLGLGLLVEQRYYRRMLADLGVRIDRASHGVYKSAYRKWSVDSTTAPDRESLEHLLDAHQELFVSAVVADRGMERERLLEILDGRMWRTADLVAARLVDSVGYRSTALAMLGRMAKLGAKPQTVNLARRPPARVAWTVPGRIAVIYAAGSIATGPSGNDILLGPFMGSSTLARQIEAAFKNDDVEAVVLRIESGGGSSLGSDLIHAALARVKGETRKPLVVSMGRAAASGGYHIALPGDRIYADRFTYTGSIGVVYARPSLEGFFRKHGVHQDDFMRGEYMRGWAGGHDWDREIQALADSAVRREYGEFVRLVANARNLPLEETERAAQGRVWMGEDALDKKLVDEIGGLEAAVADARRRGGVPAAEKIRLIEYRRPRGTWLQRAAGSLVRETLGSLVRAPEPGGVMEWAEELEALE